MEEEWRKNEIKEKIKIEENLRKEQEAIIAYENSKLKLIENKKRQQEEELIKIKEEERKIQEDKEWREKIARERYEQEINRKSL